MWKEFKEFAFGGNLVELAVAFVMAAAFGALVASLVDTIVMPLVGIIFGEPSFDNLVATINDSQIKYGMFLTALVTFIAIALGVFLFIVKPYNAYKARVASGAEEPAPPPEDVALLREIRDNLART